MSGEWEYKTLFEVIEEVFDRRGVTPTKLGGEFSDSGHRVISAKSVKQNRIDLNADEPRFVSDELFARWMRSPLASDDVILTSEAPLGELAYLSDDVDWCLGQRLFALRTDKQQLDGRYLFYTLQSEGVAHDLQTRATGTTVVGIRQSELLKVEVPLPPLPEQRRIAKILGDLDDKIELNRKMNETLEQMARALFKSWFIDFDPVRAKMEGRTPTGMDAATAALFPDRLVDSELGMIPEGWRVSKVSEIIKRLSVGQKYDQRTVSPDGRVPVLDQGKSGAIGFHNGEPGVLASIEAPVAVFANHTCCMRLVVYPFSAIQNVLPFVGCDVDTFWAYYATEGRLAFSEYKGHWPDFILQSAVLPPSQLTDLFGRHIKTLVAMKHSNETASRTLSTLRDTLLPKLVSGEVRVGERMRSNVRMGKHA